MPIIELSKENYLDIIALGDTIILFNYSTMCAECPEIHPIFEKVASEFPGRKFARLDVMLDESLTRRISVSMIPSVYVMKGDEVIYRKDWPISEEDLREIAGKYN